MAKLGTIIPVMGRRRKEENPVRLHLNKGHKATNLNQTK